MHNVERLTPAQIPLLVIIIVAMLRNLIPGFGQAMMQGYQVIKSRILEGPPVDAFTAA